MASALDSMLSSPKVKVKVKVSLTINPHAKFEVCIFSLSRDIRGPKI